MDTKEEISRAVQKALENEISKFMSNCKRPNSAVLIHDINL
jgi:hypothetical protein